MLHKMHTFKVMQDDQQLSAATGKPGTLISL